jgi:hypothetical protein
MIVWDEQPESQRIAIRWSSVAITASEMPGRNEAVIYRGRVNSFPAMIAGGNAAGGPDAGNAKLSRTHRQTRSQQKKSHR